MTRFAVGAKVRQAGECPPWRVPSAAKSEPSAAMPMPVAVRPKKCRRVQSSATVRVHRLIPWMIVSSRFKMVLATIVQAANSAGSSAWS